MTTTASCAQVWTTPAPPRARPGSPTAWTSYRAGGRSHWGRPELADRHWVRIRAAWVDIRYGYDEEGHCRAARRGPPDDGVARSPRPVSRGDRFDDDGGTMTTQTSAQTGDQSVSDRANDVKDRAADVGGTVQDKGRRGQRAPRRSALPTWPARPRTRRSRSPRRRSARRATCPRRVPRPDPAADPGPSATASSSSCGSSRTSCRTWSRRAAATAPRSEVVRQVADRLAGVRSYLEGGANPLVRRALVRAPQAGHLPSHRRRRRRPRRAGHPQRRGRAQGRAGQRPARDRRA